MRIVYKLTDEKGRYYIGKQIVRWNNKNDIMDNWWRMGIPRGMAEKYFKTDIENLTFEILECYANYTSMEQVYKVYLKDETDIDNLIYYRMKEWYKKYILKEN